VQQHRGGGPKDLVAVPGEQFGHGWHIVDGVAAVMTRDPQPVVYVVTAEMEESERPVVDLEAARPAVVIVAPEIALVQVPIRNVVALVLQHGHAGYRHQSPVEVLLVGLVPGIAAECAWRQVGFCPEIQEIATVPQVDAKTSGIDQTGIKDVGAIRVTPNRSGRGGGVSMWGTSTRSLVLSNSTSSSRALKTAMSQSR